jgi:hypothetical protein
MKARKIVTLSLGLFLVLFGLYFSFKGGIMFGLIPFIIGITLIYLSLKRDRVAGLVLVTLASQWDVIW